MVTSDKRVTKTTRVWTFARWVPSGKNTIFSIGDTVANRGRWEAPRVRRCCTSSAHHQEGTAVEVGTVGNSGRWGVGGV